MQISFLSLCLSPCWLHQLFSAPNAARRHQLLAKYDAQLDGNVLNMPVCWMCAPVGQQLVHFSAHKLMCGHQQVGQYCMLSCLTTLLALDSSTISARQMQLSANTRHMCMGHAAHMSPMLMRWCGCRVLGQGSKQVVGPYQGLLALLLLDHLPVDVPGGRLDVLNSTGAKHCLAAVLCANGHLHPVDVGIHTRAVLTMIYTCTAGIVLVIAHAVIALLP
jgi:hypothetical protein